jgi:hypothetical protein
MGIIYLTKNLINNKIYVGQSKYNNDTYLGSGVTNMVMKIFKKLY